MSKNSQTEVQVSVQDVAYNLISVQDETCNLLRSLGFAVIFGNPGSTEQPFLKNFPKVFQYVLGQEASVVPMADGFSRAIKKPVLVNLHSCAGTGNRMGNIMTAFQNKTPLITTNITSLAY